MSSSTTTITTTRRSVILWILSIFICISVLLQYTVPHIHPLLKEGNEQWYQESSLEEKRTAKQLLRITNMTTPSSSLSHQQKEEQQEQQQQEKVEDLRRDNSEEAEQQQQQHHVVTLHVIFSTSCSDQMLWESYVFFYHAMKVQQPGHVTRIASGCTEEQSEKLKLFHQTSIQTMSPNFHLHLTPDFARVRKDLGKFPYKYMNKPFGVRHWMEQALGMSNDTSTTTAATKSIEHDVVILMDPDMILLRPILHDWSQDEHIVWVQDDPLTKVVKHGFPMAQQDGYLSNEWMKYNTSYIVQDPNFVMARSDEGPRHYNTGPPYLATVRDMYRIAVLWTEYAPRVYDDHPVLFAEMYGYVLATVQLKLRHTLIKSLVVSTTTTQEREGWRLVDALPLDQLCQPPHDALLRLPVTLHYCKRYYTGPWFFSKYRLKKNYISCEAPIMAFPPPNIYQLDYWIRPPKEKEPPGLRSEKQPLKHPKQVRRETFMLCGLIGAVNEASRYFKQHNCPNHTANWNNSYTIHDSPTDY